MDPETRSRLMSGVRSKNTQPEIKVRKALHAAGFRYRLHVSSLPGKPDMVFPSRKAVIFVNGCFWHGHNCSLFKQPSTRTEFWANKIRQNQNRDTNNRKRLTELGWRHLTIWECSFRGRDSIGFDEVAYETIAWLNGNRKATEIRGKPQWHS